MASDQSTAGRGSGRGALIKLLRESQSSSGDSSSKSSPIPDSGVGTGSNYPTPPVGRATGRGRLIELLSGTSSSTPPTSDSAPRPPIGRAKLLQALKSTPSIPSVPSSAGASLKEINPYDVDGTGSIAKQVDEVTESLAQLSVPTEPEHEPEVVHKVGTKGRRLQIMTNYIRLHCDANTGVFEYEVKFEPSIHDMRLRHKLLAQHKPTIGNTKTFDGVILYLPRKLADDVTRLSCTNDQDNSTATLTIIFKRQKRLHDCIHLYNVLFTRIFKILDYVRFGRKDFDPSAPMIIPQHKLEVWPGYVTAVDEYEDGIMLCLDVSHRVLCQTTVLDVIGCTYRKDPQNYKSNCVSQIVGSIVLTRYNNRSYRIDDILYDSSPMNTFEMNGQEISYLEYYKRHYNIDIKDKSQPLLLNRQERRIIGKREKEEIIFCLVPELCYLTGLTDVMRSDFKVMRDIASFTRISPNQRMKAFEKYSQNVNSTPEAKEVLKNWGLSLEMRPLKIDARQLEEEEIIFGRNVRVLAGRNADFNKFVTSNEVLDVVPITNWLLIHCRQDSRYAKNLIDCMERNSKPMGIDVNRPRIEVLDQDRTELYVQTLRRCINANLQIVVILCPTSRDDRYAAIKKICCAELPVASQVINARTLSNEAKNRSIVQKIALQMNCKLGGTLWCIQIPFKNVMICGIDTYHEANKRSNSVSAFVASLNATYTRWFSQAGIQEQKEELVNGLCAAMVNALRTYRRMNQNLPDKIIIFRDGVGDGQLRMCNEYEIPQLQSSCSLENPGYNPQFTFIVVQKRINTRMFAIGREGLENPAPGCVVDQTITRRYLYDFFLVPQSVRQGTVSPTHYIVVHDSSNFQPDVLQRLSYKLCFLYYNWPGTVRVPACCQYAHKLAYLVGQSVKRQPSERLSDKLFYL